MSGKKLGKKQQILSQLFKRKISPVLFLMGITLIYYSYMTDGYPPLYSNLSFMDILIAILLWVAFGLGCVITLYFGYKKYFKDLCFHYSNRVEQIIIIFAGIFGAIFSIVSVHIIFITFTLLKIVELYAFLGIILGIILIIITIFFNLPLKNYQIKMVHLPI